MSKINKLFYFTDHVRPKVRTAEEAFNQMRKDFITEAHLNKYKTE